MRFSKHLNQKIQMHSIENIYIIKKTQYIITKLNLTPIKMPSYYLMGKRTNVRNTVNENKNTLNQNVSNCLKIILSLITWFKISH